MKKLIVFFALCLPLFGLNAQKPSDVKDDTQLVTATALDYAEGYYTGDAERMERAIHRDLRKVCPLTFPTTGRTFLIYSTGSGLIEPTRAKMGYLDEDKRKLSVKVLKINDNVACARVMSSQFNDYLALVKADGQWKIVNVLWTFGPDSRNRKVPADFAGEGETPAIRQVVEDMVMGVFTSDPDRVAITLHPEYQRATVVVLPQTGTTMILRDGPGALVESTRAKSGAFPEDKRTHTVDVLDIMDGLAYVEMISVLGIEYIHLAKIDGNWQIVNILRKMPAPPARG